MSTIIHQLVSLKRSKKYYIPVITFTSILFSWQMLAAGLIPPPTIVFDCLLTLIVDNNFQKDIGYSLLRLIVGFTIGASFGMLIGTLIGYYSIARHVLFPIIKFVITIPKIALLPLFLIILGIGEESKIAIISLGTFFPVVMVTYSSVLRVPKGLIESSMALGFSRTYMLRRLIFPYALPNIINSAFRLSISMGLVLLVASEMVASKYGLGNFIYYTGAELQLDKMIAALFVLGFIGIGCNKIIDFMYKYFCHWSTLSEGENYGQN